MKRAFIPLVHRSWFCVLCLLWLLVALSSCGDASSPPVWKNYQGTAFTMNYFSNWDVAAKDFYLGTHYPPLEMMQGMVFTKQGNETTFVQVVYAENTNGKASVSDLLRKFILGSLQQPVAASSLTTTALAGDDWSQGVVEKQVSVNNGSQVSVKETALGVQHAVSPNQTEIYIIIYQDTVSAYDQTKHDFFTRMVNSFHFVG